MNEWLRHDDCRKSTFLVRPLGTIHLTREKERTMSNAKSIFPEMTKEHAAQRKQLAPESLDAFKAFSRSVFADGALPAKTKQLIAVAAAHVTQCPYCIQGHTDGALKSGATPEEIMEAIWVAAEMRAGAAYAHSVIALETITKAQSSSSGS